MNPDDPLEQLKALKMAGDPLAELKKLKQPSIPLPPVAQADAAKEAAAVVQKPTEGRETTGDFEKARDAALGLATVAPQAVPGVEAAQAAVRSVVRRQPFSEALSDMRSTTDQIPGAMKFAAQLPALAAMGMLRATPAIAGALYGGASQALSPDSMPFSERATRTLLGAGTGAALGKTGDIVGNLGRVWLGPGRATSGAMTQGLEKEMGAADRANYGLAAKEGAASPHQIAGVRKILNRPVVRDFAKDVRRSGQFANASDAEILTETYASMSAAERSLERAIRKEFDPAKARNLADIKDAKQALLKEADKFMPSFRAATQAHAIKEGEIEAVGTGVDAAKRAMGATPSGDQLPLESTEAYASRIRAMSPENRKRAVRGLLAEEKLRTGFQPNAISFGGLLTSITRPNKITNFLRMAGDEGQKFADVLNKALIAAGTTVVH